MSDPVMALGGAGFEGLVRVEEMPPRGMILLRGDHADVDVKNMATGVTGLDFPAPLAAHCVGDNGIAWMSPDELLLTTDYNKVESALHVIERGLNGKHHLAEDVSDARVIFRLTGTGLHEVLAKLTPADVSPEAFAIGGFRRTRLAQAPAALWRREEAMAEVFCFRSVAQYVFDLLANAAEPDAAVGFFDQL